MEGNAWPPGSGNMARRIRAFDWSATPLGPIASWPQSLKTTIDIILSSGQAMQLAWGPARNLLYNDAYAPMLGDRHPRALGLPFKDAWPDVWDDIKPLVDEVFAGKTVKFEDMPLIMTRHGYAENTWWTFSYSPVRDEDNAIAGLLNVPIDTTARVRAERAESERETALAALRESEERRTFLLKLSDMLRPLVDSARIKAMATRLLGEQLVVNRVFYADAQDGQWMVTKGYEIDIEPLPPLPFSMAEYGNWIIDGFRAGKRLVVDDMYADPRFSDAERTAHLELQIGAEIALPLVKGGELVAMLVVHSVGPRDWSEQDLAILEATAERTWAAVERSHAQAALYESEQKYRTLFDTMDEGYAVVEVLRDESGRVFDILGVEINRAYTAKSGIPATFIGRRFSEFASMEEHWLRIYDDVSRTGIPVREENYWADADRWISAHFSRVGDDGSNLVGVVFDDVTKRKKTEIALRESEELQAFLLKLSDALRPLDAPQAILETATRLLCEQLRANRCAYYEIDAAEYAIRSDSARDVPSLVGRYPIEMFGDGLLDKHTGGQSPIVVNDVAATHGKGECEAFAAIQVAAYIGVTLFKQNRFVSGLTVHSREPRTWTANEVAIAQETAERTWTAVERSNAQLALRESEERLRDFGEASLDVLWIRDAETLRWVYLTPAFEEIYGISREDALGARDFRTWLELILPEDRAAAIEGIERIRNGERAAFEYRIQRPDDGQIRWIRNTDFPIADADGKVTMIGGVGHDITQLKASEKHQKLLLAELQHRVRNTLAVIRAITRMTAETSQSVEEMGMHLDGRIAAFARVQAAVTRDPMKGVDLETLVADTLSAAAREGDEFTIDGPPVALYPKAAETFSLVFHELTTNAIKYGALSVKAGLIDVRWRVDAETLALEWAETGQRLDPGEARREGFGTELLTQTLAYEMKAEVMREFHRDGIHYDIRIPLAAIVKWQK